MCRYFFAMMILVFTLPASADNNVKKAVTQPIPVEQLSDYSQYPQVVKNLISIALTLTKMNLTYTYGSSDPKNKGMDCSGTIYYLLSQAQVHDVPRDSDDMFSWVGKEGKLYHVTSLDLHSPDFANLQPGDLLFWSGTYDAHRDTSAITHVMLYLGKNKNGQPLMFGSSDGRTYQGKKMWGVSVFDFQLPNEKTSAKFVGYSCIPRLTCSSIHPKIHR